MWYRRRSINQRIYYTGKYLHHDLFFLNISKKLSKVKDIGWKWTFGICAILFGVFVFLVVFFVPETAYNRVPIEERFRGIALNNSDSEKPAADLEQQEVTPAEKTPAQIEASEKKEPYWRTLRLYTGTYCDTPLWKIMCRPFIVFFYPAVLWGFLVYGTTLTWIVVFSVVNASIFTLPPYNFSVSETGLISLSPFILTIIGEVIAGPLNDYLCLYLTKKNHGIYEPEFRLVLMSIVLLVGVTGFFGFGAPCIITPTGLDLC